MWIASSLPTRSMTCIRMASRSPGTAFYVLGLRDTGVTLAYDATSGTWARWTSLTARAPASCTIAQTGGVATITWTAHGRSDGDPVVISGADQSAYNGLHQVRYLTANTLAFDVPAATTSPATGRLSPLATTS